MVPLSAWPAGAPVGEYLRSPAALRVARQAQRSGLFLFQYEHRAHLELPEDWVPEHDLELVEPPRWVNGILPERKYQSFRHDQLTGGFHPGHRAKWATHELCHGLVGFAWTPSATPFFHATAGRLAELLPVVLWYFLDECYLKRCPVHEYGGALFRTHCLDCESIASPTLDDPHVRERLSDALRYLDREFAAVARSRRLKRPVPHIWGSLDLCSDGLAYAAAHGPRLQSETFHRYAELFYTPGEGLNASLDALEQRIIEVLGAIVTNAPLRPWGDSPDTVRDQWIRQDIAWRVAMIAHQCGSEVSTALWEALAAFSDRNRSLREGMHGLETSYNALFETVVLPPWDAISAVGYTVPNGQGRALNQLLEGVQSAVPITATALGSSKLSSEIDGFVEADVPARMPLASRFGTWMDGKLGNEVRDLLRYEVMLATTGPRDGVATALGTEMDLATITLAQGVRVGRFDVQPAILAEEVEFGDRILLDGSLPDVDGQPVESYPCGLICYRTATGQVETVEVEAGVAEVIMANGPWTSIDKGVLAALMKRGILVTNRWTID